MPGPSPCNPIEPFPQRRVLCFALLCPAKDSYSRGLRSSCCLFFSFPLPSAPLCVSLPLLLSIASTCFVGPSWNRLSPPPPPQPCSPPACLTTSSHTIKITSLLLLRRFHLYCPYWYFYEKQGGGPGGYVAAIKAGQLGLKTACVEMRGRLGGTCLNVGCIPSKALLTSSHHYHDALHNFQQHGIVVKDVAIDLNQMQKSKSDTVESLTGGIEFLLKKNKVDYFVGKGSLASPNTVQVSSVDGLSHSSPSTTLETKHVVIATGSEVTPLPPVPVDNATGKIVDSTGALEISSVRTQYIHTYIQRQMSWCVCAVGWVFL